MAGVQQQSCLLNIPQDIVEIILPHLMPVVKGDKSGPSLSLQQSFANTTSLRPRGRSEPVDWKDTCSALRLTCHALANQKTINRTLFHTIHLYPSPFSLDGLAELSMSPLATLVRRLVLMHPQFQEELRCPSRNKGPRGKADEAFIQSFRRYSRARDEQRSLLISGVFVEHGATFISRLANLSSVVLKGGVRSSVAGGQPPFISKRYPSAQLFAEELEEPAFCSTFWPFALRTLALSRITRLELATEDGMLISQGGIREGGLARTWQFLRLENLQSLRLDFDSFSGSDTVGPLLHPVIKSTCRTLQRLELSYRSLAVDHNVSFNTVFNQRFSVLKAFHLDATHAAGKLKRDAPIAQFLARHATLRRLEILGLLLNSSHWRAIFKALRGISMEWISLRRCRTDKDGTMSQVWCFSVNSTSKVSAGAKRAEEELQRYWHEDGPWTEGLRHVFGDIDA